MDRKRKIGFIAFLTVFIVAACLLSISDNHEREELPAITLSDGRWLQLVKVSFGRVHELRTGSPIRAFFQEFLPRGWLGPKIKKIRLTTREDTLIPFLSIELPTVAAPRPDWSRFKVVCDSGETFDITSWSSGFNFQDRPMNLPRLGVFPRRDASFTLTGTVDRLPFAIKIPNPLHGTKFPTWLPQPLDTTNHHHGYDIRLKDPKLRMYKSGAFFQTSVDIFESSRKVNHWFKTSYRLKDATGNHGFRIPTNEPTWKIDVTLTRQYPAPWAPHEFHEFALRSLPAETNYSVTNLGLTLNGTPISRLWMGGPGHYVMGNGVITNASPLASGRVRGLGTSSNGKTWKMDWSADRPWMILEMPSLPRDIVLSVFLIDSDGKHGTASWTGSAGAAGTHTRHFKLEEPKDATPPFTVRMGLQTNLHSEFVIDPKQLPRIAPPSR
ncbi:MAG: hypothetical protein ACPGVU_08465 [Limisphaerales bacterium]